MNKHKPTTYHHWRKKLNDAIWSLGYLCDSDDKESRCAKSVYKLRQRIKRLRKRLDAESEAGTSSFFQALLEQMKSWKK